MADFTLPELGENVTAGDVLRVLVKPGDTVAKDQTVLELETDKATIEVPSSVAGRVTAVAVKAGRQGQGRPGGAERRGWRSGGRGRRTGTRPRPPRSRKKRSRKTEADEQKASGEAQRSRRPKARRDGGREAARRDAGGRADAGTPKAEAARGAGGKDKSGKKEKADRAASPSRQIRTAGCRPSERAPPAAPAASNVVAISRGAAPERRAGSPPRCRRLRRRRQCGGWRGSSASRSRASPAPEPTAAFRSRTSRRTRSGWSRAPRTAAGLAAAEPLPDFSRWGEVERQPMRALRRKTAEHLSVAWATIPHVTQHDLADVTALEDLRKKYAKEAEAAGGNLTVTAIAVKVVAAALKTFPQFNASIDMAAEEIIHKKYVNIGVAVDTDRGLLVPVVRDADTKNIIQIAVEIARALRKGARRQAVARGDAGRLLQHLEPGRHRRHLLHADRERAGSGDPGHLTGADGAGLPGQQFVPRLMLPLSLSYDHRAIDGADGIRFLRWIVQALEQPFLLALQG